MHAINRRFEVSIKRALVFALVPAVLGSAAVAQTGRDYITIVGSSTVYPFTTTVAEQFGRSGKFKTPKVESTGTGGGFKLFCGGVGAQYPDLTNASRAIKPSEVDICRKAGVTEVLEVKVGYDGLTVANSKKAPLYKLTRKDLYLALAKQVPDPANSQNLIAKIGDVSSFRNALLCIFGFVHDFTSIFVLNARA